MQTDQTRETCELITRRVVAKHAPHLEADFDDLFDAVYEIAPTAEPVDAPPVYADVGQGALDPETLRELSVMAMIVIPTYKIVVEILGASARDTLGYSIDRLKLRQRIREKQLDLIFRWPRCETWIDIAAHFAETVLTQLKRPDGKDDGKN